MKYFLGVEVVQGTVGNFICQKKYATEVLKGFDTWECKVVKTSNVTGSKLNKDDEVIAVCESNYKQTVGCLMYLTATWPDLVYSASILSKFMSKPNELHLQAVKRMLRYLKRTLEFGSYTNQPKED